MPVDQRRDQQLGLEFNDFGCYIFKRTATDGLLTLFRDRRPGTEGWVRGGQNFYREHSLLEYQK